MALPCLGCGISGFTLGPLLKGFGDRALRDQGLGLTKPYQAHAGNWVEGQEAWD